MAVGEAALRGVEAGGRREVRRPCGQSLGVRAVLAAAAAGVDLRDATAAVDAAGRGEMEDSLDRHLRGRPGGCSGAEGDETAALASPG